MILTIGNTKGGVGKSMLSVQLAIARKMDGRDVWLVDGDPQATSSIAIDVRAEAGHLPSIACSSYPGGKMLRSQVEQQAGKYDDVIIDAGGRDSSALRAALVLTDVLLLPFSPCSFDLWAMDDIAPLIEEARSMREGLKVYVMLNSAEPNENSAENKDAREALEAYPGVEYLDVPIVARKVFKASSGSGRSVREYKPRNRKAIEEVNKLVSVLFK